MRNGSLQPATRDDAVPDASNTTAVRQKSTSAYAFNRTKQTFLSSNLKVADTHWTRLRGLLGTKTATFTAGKGLLIVPCRGVHTFGMGFAIDVVYLDQDNKVVHVEENVKPWRITPVLLEASSVLELPVHTICETDTQVGDEIEIDRAAE